MNVHIARHDRIVNLIVKDIKHHFTASMKMYTNTRVTASMFHLCNDQNAFSHLSANTPDVVVVNEESREVSVLEMACTFDSNLEEAFMTKVIKYQQLVDIISELGYRCTLLVFIFGSLGHAHRLVVRGLRLLGLSKKDAKGLTKYCSVSAIIGSRHIWRRRCHLYP